MIDTHLHLVGRDRQAFPLINTPIEFLPYEKEAQAYWTRDDVDAESVLSFMDRAGVDKMVAVQASSAYGYDNRYAVHVAAQFPERVVTVIALDITSPDCGDEIARLAKEPGVVGVRFIASAQDAMTWVGTQHMIDIFDTADAAGLILQVAGREQHLPLLRPALVDRPHMRFILDHCAHPSQSLEGGKLRSDAPLLEFASLPNVYVKVSNLAMRIMAPSADASLVTEQLVAAYGADRLFWGTDYPHTYGDGYLALVEQAKQVFGRLRPSDQEQIFDTTARTLYGL